MSGLPPGFVLDQSQQPPQQSSLPNGFVLDQQPSQPRGFMDNAADFIKSIPHGMLTGISSLPNANPALSQDEVNTDMAARANARNIAEQQGITHAPEGRAGRFGDTIGQALGSPLSYVGPGSLALKAGTAALGGAGSEAAGQATEGTPYEIPARLAGGVAGGMAAGRMLGPSPAKAAIPTQAELRTAASQGYDRALQSGLELDPRGVAQFAASARQDLSNGPRYAFTGGQLGTAPKTFAALDALENATAGATTTTANLNALRTHLGDLAGEVQPTGPGGLPRPTSDAVAAMALKDRLANYLENIPQNNVLAGDPQGYRLATQEANGNYAAASRLGSVDARLTKAENSFARQIAGSRDRLVRTKIGNMLDNPQATRGFTPEEIAQVQKINDGTFASNTLSQLGRGGVGVIPIGAHVAAAVGSGGASIPASLAIAAPLYAARKGAEAITMSRANQLADMLAKRSPLYQSRVQALPPPDTISNKAAIVRALLNAAPR